MKKLAPFFFCIFLVNLVQAQKNYPTDYFTNPIEIPLVLSGTFGELRSNHFHAGLDIKTQQRTGLNVVAAGPGYVSRIKVAHWGYGKALYITHPNGYTTVYGHLKKFSPAIEAYVKKKQYEKESFEIQLYPQSSELKVSKGELVAFSGNSGSSGGPHLHFEVRDTKANPINPMHFGIDIPDHKKPIFKNIVAYAKNDTSQVNKSNNSVDLFLKKENNGDLVANKIYAYGKIGIGANATDRLDGAINNNGLYSLEMEVNGKKVFKYKVETFSFNESRYINDLIDYQRYSQKNQKIQRCFVEPNNKLSIYSDLIDKGFINIKDSLDYQVKLIASDFKGNKTNVIIPIQGKKDTIITYKKIKETPYYFKAKAYNKISDSVITASFPKNIFYDDFYFDFSYKDGVAKMHNETVPLHGSFTLSFDASKYSREEINQMYIARKSKKGRTYYYNTKYKDKKLYTSSKNLGNFILLSDESKPKIVPKNFKSNQNMSKNTHIILAISDKGSGIKSYRAEIDGKWVLMEYLPKKGLLMYDFKDNQLVGTNHKLKVVVKDNVNNTTTFIADFIRKE